MGVGVVWCGVVWCGVVWCGVVWCGVGVGGWMGVGVGGVEVGGGGGKRGRGPCPRQMLAGGAAPRWLTEKWQRRGGGVCGA